MTTSHEGLTHLPTYRVEGSNVELFGSKVDHLVKYTSSQTEPAWTQSQVGKAAGLLVWRIEDFQVIAWPKSKYGTFHEGDSYIVLHSYQVGKEDKLRHDIFFWLGQSTSQDEAGTAAYKTVELDEFLRGVATQHREAQDCPSPAFQSLFPRIIVRSGGVASGFTHVEPKAEEKRLDLYRVTKTPGAGMNTPSAKTSTLVKQVSPSWTSLVEDDCFILDTGDKMIIWQGKKASPIEKAKAAQVAHDMTISRQCRTEVVAQTDSRSYVVLQSLGASPDSQIPASSVQTIPELHKRPKRLFRLSDASGQLSFDMIKNGGTVLKSDLQSQDVFVFDSGLHIWVWQGAQASNNEKAMWLKVAQAYLRTLGSDAASAHLTPIAKVVDGYESASFLSALSR